MNDAPSPHELLNQFFGGAWITQAVSVAADLGIADILAKGPLTADQLAGRTDSHGASLYRVLRALASVGIFAEDAAGRFSMTPLAEPLRSDVPGSQRARAIMMGAEFHQAWGELLHSARTGEAGFVKRYGQSFFQHMEKHPDRHAIYDRVMTAVHGAESEPMVDAYDFSTFSTVVDVGGGNGSLLAAVLRRNPAVRRILFDLPAVADRSREVVASWGGDGRCEVVGGDFFRSVPPGADAYVLRHVIHDWQDGDSVAILRNCREAMSPRGKVLLVEYVIPKGNEPSLGKWLDLMMLVVEGRERTRDEYERLYSQAGLKLERVVPTSAGVSVIEGGRA